MKLGVMTVLLNQTPVEETFSYLSSLGVETVEIGTGGWPGNAHLNPEELLENPSKLTEFQELLKKYHLEISVLSVHSNHVHPDKKIAEKAHREFINTCKIAEKLGVDTVVTFSGCPGDHPGAKYPNWVTCAWPDDYPAILKYQWDDVLIPYWQAAAKEAADYGVSRIAFEMHPGFCVYNPHTLLKIRGAVGESIGANFDPSHLFWQGIQPSEAIKALKGSIYHFHAKDTKIDASNTKINGVLDTKSLSDITNRSWVFRTVGFGHGATQWREIISALRLVGYDRSISIEHEDGLLSIQEGLEKAVEFLKTVIIKEEAPTIWWT